MWKWPGQITLILISTVINSGVFSPNSTQESYNPSDFNQILVTNASDYVMQEVKNTTEKEELEISVTDPSPQDIFDNLFENCKKMFHNLANVNIMWFGLAKIVKIVFNLISFSRNWNVYVCSVSIEMNKFNNTSFWTGLHQCLRNIIKVNHSLFI